VKVPEMAARHSLYVENRTRQFLDLNYRLPGEASRVRNTRIAPGGEALIYQEAPLAVLRTIVDANRQFGLVPRDRVGAGFVGFCYRFDPPVDYDEEDRLYAARKRAKEAASEQAILHAALEAAGADVPPSAASASDPRGRRRNSGGRPEQFNWLVFDREVVRLANTPDGLPSRRDLMKHMLDWCTREWGDEAPGVSTVRERVAGLYPDPG
jgi:hypothetical protein